MPPAGSSLPLQMVLNLVKTEGRSQAHSGPDWGARRPTRGLWRPSSSLWNDPRDCSPSSGWPSLHGDPAEPPSLELGAGRKRKRQMAAGRAGRPVERRRRRSRDAAKGEKLLVTQARGAARGEVASRRISELGGAARAAWAWASRPAVGGSPCEGAGTSPCEALPRVC